MLCYNTAMRIDIITVFPEMFRGFLGESMIARAAKAGKVSIRTVDLRDFSRDQRRTVESIIAATGISPPVRTKSPIDTSSVTSRITRASKPS